MLTVPKEGTRFLRLGDETVVKALSANMLVRAPILSAFHMKLMPDSYLTQTFFLRFYPE